MQRRSLLLLFLLVGFIGCGPARSRVFGTVHLNGKPLPGGTIIFMPQDNQIYPVSINPDGSYAIDGIPRGKVLVAVVGEEPRVVARAQPSAKQNDQMAVAEVKGDDAGKKSRVTPALASPGIPVPAIYTDPKKSGLSFDLKISEQEYTVELK